MTDPDGSYRPRSPDFSSFTVPPPSADAFPSPLAHRASYDASPFFAISPSRIPQQYVASRVPPSPDMARRVTRAAVAAAATPLAPPPPSLIDPRPPVPAPPQPAEFTRPRPWDGVEVRTKFPVARIKRIMQADEDVGKVAQVTPIAVGKAPSLTRYPIRWYCSPMR
jgi:Dr1-associated corepressor